MKKFILGLIMGGLIMGASTVIADSGIIGKTIQGQYPVQVNGEYIKTQAIIVDGNSFLPVREISEMIGYEVFFDRESGIKLESISAMESINEEENIIFDNTTIDDISTKIFTINSSFDSLKNGTKTEVIQIGNEFYINSDIFVIKYNEADTIIRIVFSKLHFTLTHAKEYSKDVTGFYYEGIPYTRLSALRLKATIQDDVLLIEK